MQGNYNAKIYSCKELVSVFSQTLYLQAATRVGEGFLCSLHQVL